MIPSTLSRAAVDRRLTPQEVRVYTILHEHLTFTEYRPVKRLWLARVSGLRHKANVTRVLGALVSAGYLRRGAPVCESPGRCYVTYLLSQPSPPGITTAPLPAA